MTSPPRTTAALQVALVELLFETAGAGVAFVDRELRYVRVNAALAAMNGRAAEAHVGRALREVIPSHTADRVEPMLRRVMETGEGLLDLPLAVDGAGPFRRHFLSSYHPVRERDGAICGLVALVIERPPAEAELRETLRASEEHLRAREAQLHAVLQHLPVGVIIAEAPSGRILQANAQAEAIWRHPALLARDVAGYREYHGFHPEDGRPYAPHEWPLARAVQHGEEVRGEWIRFLRGDGTSGTMRVSATPLRDAVGSVRAAVVLFEDVTPQLEAEAAERAARAVAEQAARRTEQLLALTAALAGTRTLEEAAEVVVAQAVAAAGARTGVLVLRPRGADHLEIVRQTGFGADVHERYARTPLDTAGPAAACVRAAEPIWVSGAGDDTAARRFPALADVWAQSGARAIAAVPLEVAGLTIGAMSFTWDAPHALAEEERAFFLALGRQAAQAIGRAQLFEAERTARTEAEHARQRTALLAEVSQSLAESVEVNAALEAVVRTVVPLLGDYAVLCLLEPDGVARSVAAAHGDPARQSALEAMMRADPPSLGGSSPSSHAMTTGETLLASSVPAPAETPHADGPASVRLSDELAPRAFVSVPLKMGGGGAVVGVLTLVMTASGRGYGAADVVVAEEVARRAALAIERSMLHTAEREARAEAEAANRAKSQFLATMSHELRTPLNAIGGYAELMEMGIRGPVTPLQAEDLRRIQTSQRHLLGLINEVLNYAKLETGTVFYDLADVPVREVLVAAESLVAPQARAKGLRLTVAEQPATVAARADAEKLRQILVNLLSNAVKFTDRGGAIEVRVVEHGDRVAIQVHDTGIGIPADKLEAIFEPFVQVRADLTRTAEGTGLGLAISRDLARGMGGDLTAESRFGEGSAFTVVLPRA